MNKTKQNNNKTTTKTKQIPIGLEEYHEGVVDLVAMKAFRFGGKSGLEVLEGPVPGDLAAEASARRLELVERVAEADDRLAEMFLGEEEITEAELKAAIRRATLANKFQVCVLFVCGGFVQ